MGAYVDLSAFLVRDGSRQLTANWNLGNYAITVPSIYGSVSASGNLSLMSTSDGTKGKIYLGASNNSYFNEVDETLVINSTVSAATPTSGSHLTTKDYVDAISQGLEYQESVLDRYDPTGGLPGSPGTGDRYIATATANGWTIHYIYEYNGATWDEFVPNEGWACWVEDEDVLYMFNATAWVKFGSTITHGNLLALNQDDHSGYPWMTGRSGGQTLIGDTDSGGFLRLQSTSDATKGRVYLSSGSDNYMDEASSILNINGNVDATGFRHTGDTDTGITFFTNRQLIRSGNKTNFDLYSDRTEINPDADIYLEIFGSATEGLTPSVRIGGYRSGDTQYREMRMSIATAEDNAFIFSNVSKFIFNGAVQLGTNILKSSAGTDAIALTGANVEVKGELTIRGDVTVTDTAGWIMNVDAANSAEIYLDRGSTSYDAGIRFFTAGSDTWYLGLGYSSVSEDFDLYWGGGSPKSVIRAKSSGYVGIGIDPACNLHVHQPIASSSCNVQITRNETGSGSTAGIVFGLASNGNAQFWLFENNDFYIGTNNTERLRIANDNHILSLGNSVIKSWPTTASVFQLGSVGSMTCRTATTAGAAFIINTNAYGNASNPDYIIDDKASQYSQQDGKHTFNVAIAGIADDPITWITAMVLANDGTMSLGSCINAGTDTDKFLVLDAGGNVDFRTGAEVLSDIGGVSGTHTHDGQTLQMDGVNSDGGAFNFYTTGTLSFNQNIQVNPDDNSTICTFGNVKVGALGSDEAYFAHYDKMSSSNYCVKQDSAGTSFLNGQNECYLKISGATYIGLSSNKVNVQKLLETDNVTMGKSTAESWSASVTWLQLGGNGTLNCTTSEQAGAILKIMENAYTATSNEYYISSDYATKYRQGSGEHVFRVGPSGTAGNPITWTTVCEFKTDTSANFPTWITTPKIEVPDALTTAFQIIKGSEAFFKVNTFTSPEILYLGGTNTQLILQCPDNDSSALDIRFGATSIIKLDSTNNLEVLHIGQTQNLTEIIEMPESYSDGIHRLVGKKVTTTDATETTCASVTLSDDSVYHFTVDIIAEETTSNDEQASYKICGTFYRDGGGGATLVGSVTQLHVAESTGTMDVTMDANSNDARVRVTGIASTSIRWIAYITYQKLTLS